MSPVTWDAVTWFLVGSIAVGLIRVFIGPTTPDRLVALNLVAAQVLAILVIVAVKEDLSIYLDVALVYDIFGFVGLLAVTRFFSRGKEGL